MSVVLGMMSLQLWPQKHTNVLHQLAIPSYANAMPRAKLTSICCYCCQFDAACVSIWYPSVSYSMIVCAYLFTSDWWPVMPDVNSNIYTHISHISNWFAFMQKQWKLQHLCLKCVSFSCRHTKWVKMRASIELTMIDIVRYHYQCQDFCGLHPPRPQITWRACLRGYPVGGLKAQKNKHQWHEKVGN